jgi:Beta protein
VPILLARRGELLALADTSPAVRDMITPLLVIPPITWDYEAESWQATLDDHLDRMPAALQRAWPDRRAFVDLLLLEDGPLASGVHPLVWLTAQCAALGVELIPTVSPARSAAYRTAVAIVVARDGSGACIRLGVDDWPINTPGALGPLLTELGVGPDQVDLILDLGSQTGALALTALRQQLSSLPNLQDWRSLVVASTGMPQAMPLGQGLQVIPRNDWLLFERLLTTGTPPARLPTYADYAITSPEPPPDIDPRVLTLRATLRYTTLTSWLITRGQLWKAPGGRSQGGAAMVPAATNLAAHPDYLGAGHCGCEAWVASVIGGGSGGSGMVWRRYGTLHHLVVVTNQLSTPLVPSASPGP